MQRGIADVGNASCQSDRMQRARGEMCAEPREARVGATRRRDSSAKWSALRVRRSAADQILAPVSGNPFVAPSGPPSGLMKRTAEGEGTASWAMLEN
eukprot:8873164-Pyramimonas_sp.AAC.1